MASSSTFLLVAVALLSLCSLSSSIQEETVRRAAEILSDSGYISMSLTVQLLSKELFSKASTATVFSPSDNAFANFGQPSFALLQIHFSPVAYSFDELQFLPFGSKIPTLSPGRSLTVTTRPSDNRISIDNVKIDGSPIYNDGILVVFTADNFFDMDFKILSPAPNPSPETAPSATIEFAPFIPIPSPSIETTPLSPVSSPNLECPVFSGDRAFTEAGKNMRSEGFSIMAAFLDLQLVQFDDDDTPFTVFAPIDGALKERIGDFTGWGSLFLQHVAPCEVSFSDLAGFGNGSVLSTLLEGFWINVTRSGDLLLLNGVPVVFPDLYHGDRLIVHGIQDVLLITPQSSEDEGASSPSGDGEEFVVNEF